MSEMTEKILEEILLGRDITRQIGCENDDPMIEYVFEFDIQSKNLRKKLKVQRIFPYDC